jgi:hypothetical protein
MRPCRVALIAAAIMPIVSLERCTTILRLDEIEADRTRFRALGADTVPDRLLGVLRHQRFQLSLRSLVLKKGLARTAE